MKVLITGGCGFVGTNLVAALDRLGGFQVRVFDNETMGRREHLGATPVEFVHGDLLDRKAVDAALNDIEAVVHLAADTRVLDSIENPQFNFNVNVVGSLNLLEGMRARGIKRLINASTGGAIVGDAVPPVHEEMVPRPLAPYGASKLAVEGYCSAYSGSYGFNCISLRFSNVFGPRSFHKGSVVAAFFKQILKNQPLTVYGDGTQTRDYVFVKDICSGITAALTADLSGAVQLGSGKPLSINELIAAMKAVVTPRDVEVIYKPFRAGEVVATYCDITKARRDLAFAPTISLEDGLRETWAWFLSQDGKQN